MDPELYGPRLSLPLDPIAAACLHGCKRAQGWDQDTGAPLGTNESIVGFGLSLLAEGRIPTPEQYPVDRIKGLTVQPGGLSRGKGSKRMDPARDAAAGNPWPWPTGVSVRLTDLQTKRLQSVGTALIQARRLQLRSMYLGTLRLAIMAAWYDLGCPKPGL